MLFQLRVKGFKSLHDVDVELAKLVVVFGPNAAGKSNLLEALVLLSRLVRERTIAGALEAGFRGYPVEAFTLPRGGEDEAAERRLRLEALMGTDAPSLAYAVEVGIRPETGHLRLVDEKLSRRTGRGNAGGSPAVERVGEGGDAVFRVRRKGKPSHPYEERHELHHTNASNQQYSGKFRYPDFDQLRSEVGAWSVVYLDPREVMRRAQPPRNVEDIGDRGELLVPFLHRLASEDAHRKAFQAIVRAARAVIPSIEDVRTELVKSRGEVDLFVLQDGTWMPARVISEGTLRVLALCAMAANPFRAGLVAFEEPENGVHPRRVEVVTRLLASAARGRQVVVTTHSPLVVGEIVHLVRTGELAAEDVRLLQCSGGPGGTQVRAFNSQGTLFADGEMRSALAAAEDADIVQAALLRGWLDA